MSTVLSSPPLVDEPTQSMPQTGKKNKQQPEPAQQGAGLKMAAHPLLLETTLAAPQSKKDRYKPMQPKFASIKVRVAVPWVEDLALMQDVRQTFVMYPLLPLLRPRFPPPK